MQSAWSLKIWEEREIQNNACVLFLKWEPTAHVSHRIFNSVKINASPRIPLTNVTLEWKERTVMMREQKIHQSYHYMSLSHPFHIAAIGSQQINSQRQSPIPCHASHHMTWWKLIIVVTRKMSLVIANMQRVITQSYFIIRNLINTPFPHGEINSAKGCSFCQAFAFFVIFLAKMGWSRLIMMVSDMHIVASSIRSIKSHTY